MFWNSKACFDGPEEAGCRGSRTGEEAGCRGSALVKRLYCSPGSSFAGKEDLVTIGYFRVLEFWKEFKLLSRKKVNQTEPQGQLVLIPEWTEPCEGGLSGVGTSLAV